jgi:hypothetical protein
MRLIDRQFLETPFYGIRQMTGVKQLAVPVYFQVLSE